MPEVIFNGPAGRLEGRYQPSKEKSAPIAIILHPHPQFGGTMNNKIVYDLFYMFQKRLALTGGAGSQDELARPEGDVQGKRRALPAPQRTTTPASSGRQARCKPLRSPAVWR